MERSHRADGAAPKLAGMIGRCVGSRSSTASTIHGSTGTGISATPTLRRARESSSGLFVAEGVTVIGRLVTSPYPVVSVLATEPRALEVAAVLGDDDEVPVLVVAREVLDAVAGFPVHRGALALGRRRPEGGLADLPERARTVVVLEGCNDHENLGAVARSARALGADALVLSPSCADPLYRRSVRVSMGEILHLPLVQADPWPEALGELARRGWSVWAFTPAADATPLDGLPVGPADRVALLFGAEGPGLTVEALAGGRPVRIPIREGVDSLNLGHAAAVAAHHVDAARRRGRS